MNGGILPLHSSPPSADPFLPRPLLLKRLASRLRVFAHTASPPPRLLLVVLLAAQILVLAVIRLGPIALPPSPSLPLFVGGSAYRSPLKFFPAESKGSLSLPLQETRPTLPQDSNAAALRASESGDERTLEELVSGDEDKRRSETHTRVGDDFPTRYGKSLEERAVNAVDELFPAAVETAVVDASATDRKPVEVARRHTVDELLPRVEDSFATKQRPTGIDVSHSFDEHPIDNKKLFGETARANIGENPLLHSVEDSFLSDARTAAYKATLRAQNGSAEGDATASGEGIVDTVTTGESAFLGDSRSVKQKTPILIEELTTKEATGQDTLDSEKGSSVGLVGEKKSATAGETAAEDSIVQDAFSIVEDELNFEKDRSGGIEKEKSDISEHTTAEDFATQDALSSVEEKLNFDQRSYDGLGEEEKTASAEQSTAEESTLNDTSPNAEEKSSSDTLTSIDSAIGKPQKEPVVSKKGSTERTVIAENLNLLVSSECPYGYVYMYDLPAVFNHDIVANCSELNPWTNNCHTLANGGLGESLEDASPLGQTGSWFTSDQFTAEIVFHNRMLQHPCLTDNPELALGFYVPFYAGLDVGRYLWREFPAERRDRVSKQLLEWLNGQAYWKRSGGWNHFMMIGRITWDFRRAKDEDWGSGFFYIPPMLNTTRLLIERNPWDEREMAVPYPTNFHPQSDADVRAWQDHLKNLKRTYLFSFAGARRSGFPNDFRDILLSQCEQAQSCKSLDCSNQVCNDGQKSLQLFLNSTFCLQPRGDSFTRRSTFDCVLAGSIPVFFWHRSAYFQYKWHLPSDDETSSYSVFIPKEDMRNGSNIEQILTSLSPEKIHAMQETVIKMIPRIVYAYSGFSLKEHKDAFDVAIEGVLRSFKQRRSN